MQFLGKHKNMLKAVTNKEIKSKKAALKKELAKPMYLLAEIVVPTKKEAEKIIVDIRRGKAFSEVAAQKSIVDSAKTNGLLGWVKSDIYASDIMNTIDEMNLNEMTSPMQIDKGWLIVLLLDKQEGAQNGEMPVWDLAQLATPKNKTVDFIPTLFKMTTCDEFMTFADKNAVKESARRGMTDPNQLPPQLKQTLKSQKVGTPIGPIQTDEGDLFFMKCGTQMQSVVPTDDAIKTALEIEKMDELSEKLLRQVKRYVVVEYK
jgi:parvulin-like peptidyl-prolyl isomerase